MESDKNDKAAPLLGLVITTVVCIVLIHLWVADLCAEWTAISPDTAYFYLMTLLGFLQIWRGWCIWTGKDVLSNMVDRLLGK